mgnify:CR=1 FL=1
MVKVMVMGMVKVMVSVKGMGLRLHLSVVQSLSISFVGSPLPEQKIKKEKK